MSNSSLCQTAPDIAGPFEFLVPVSRRPPDSQMLLYLPISLLWRVGAVSGESSGSQAALARDEKMKSPEAEGTWWLFTCLLGAIKQLSLIFSSSLIWEAPGS